MRKWLRTFNIPEIPEVPNDADVRQKLAEEADEKIRMVTARQPEIMQTVTVARKHMNRNHYAQRLFDVYGGNPR